MAAANYKDIVHIDISSVAISLMQEKYRDHSALTCKDNNNCNYYYYYYYPLIVLIVLVDTYY